jgi:hypothetical protein
MNPFLEQLRGNILTPAEVNRLRRAELRRRAIRKRVVLDRCRTQSLEAKAKLIVTPKGKNGRSMNVALLAQHGIKKGGQP